jgi:hypothetical protein
MKRYYDNRRKHNECGQKWDKSADLQNIFSQLPKNCVSCEAIAGTFFMTWRRPRIQTEHSETNYWACKIRLLKVKGKWVHRDGRPL